MFTTREKPEGTKKASRNFGKITEAGDAKESKKKRHRAKGAKNAKKS